MLIIHSNINHKNISRNISHECVHVLLTSSWNEWRRIESWITIKKELKHMDDIL